MEDRSTEHSPRVDDAMAEAVEPITPGAPVDAEPVPGALGDDERRRRSELAIALRPSAFPGERDALRRTAQSENAPEWILELLDRLPIDTRFDTVQDVWQALGGHHEVRDAVEPPPEQVDTHERGTTDDTRVAVPTNPPAGRSLVKTGFDVAFVGIGRGVSAIGAAASIGRRVVGASKRLLHLGG